MADVWPPEISIVFVWFADSTFPESNQSTSETVYDAFNFSLELLSVFSKQLA